MADRSESINRRGGQQREVSQEDRRKREQTQEAIKKALSKKKGTSTFWQKYQYHIILGGLGFIIVASLLSTLFGKTKKLHLTPVIELDEIQSHNGEGYTYNLGPNDYFSEWTLADAKKILENHFSYSQNINKCAESQESAILETSFNFRERFPNCETPVYDQRNCSSSFAVASASVLSDRRCMLTGQNIRFSPQHFLSCQEDASGNECAGGSIASFLEFARKDGLVDENCFAYKGESNVECPASINECEKYHVVDYCVQSGVEAIKREILKNGPVIGYTPIYRDFLVYKNGIYRVLEGTSRFQGGHAVKVIGWGQNQDGEEYWIIENSWGESWGQKGLAHVAIGQDKLLFDQYGFAPNPKFEKVQEEAKIEEPAQAEPEEVKV